MGSETRGHRPPSPPHSNDGDFGLIPHYEPHSEPYTPPRSIRPTSSESLYDPYADHSMYPPPPPPPTHIYYASPQPTFVRRIGRRSSPAPTEHHITTRSGKTLGSPIRPAPSRASRPKRTKAAKAHKKGVTPLPGPLSKITQDYSAPVRDMEAWVKRPKEDREAEVEKNKGKIARPMNSFMLYRSAYAERVKQFCKENNHQVVSQVTGQSWPMEPSSIREMYERFANIERENHSSAFPDYKFAPNKNAKKRGRGDDDSESDGEWEGSRATKRSKAGRRDDSRSLASSPFEPDEGRYIVQYPAPQPHPSSYQALNPHAPVPFHFGPDGMRGGYYQPQAVPYQHNIDDVKFNEIDHNFAPFDMGAGLTGMPDANSDLLHSPIHDIPPEQMLDPRLAQLDPNYSLGPYDIPQDMYTMPRSYPYGSYPPQPTIHTAGPMHPGMVTLTETMGEWPQSGGKPGSDFDAELQNF